MLEVRRVGDGCPDVCVQVRECDLLRLLSLAVEAADEIAATVDAQYPLRHEQPVQMRRYRRDMMIVADIRFAVDELALSNP